MIKVLRPVLLLAVLLYLSLTIQGQHSFEIFIDSEDDCILWEGCVDDSGNIILVGDIGQYETGDYDALVMKVYPDGEYITMRFELMDTLSVFSTVDVLDNGNYFITGSYSTQAQYLGRDHLWVVILDQDLNLVGRKSFLVKEPYMGYGTSACSLIDNEDNVVVTALVINEDTESKTAFADFGFYKFNQDGDTLLSRYYSYTLDELPFELMKMPNSDDLMLLERATMYNNHVELMQLDPELNIISVNQLWTLDITLYADVSSDYWVSDTEFLVSGRRHLDDDDSDEICIGVYRVDTSANFLQELLLDKMDTVDYPARRNSMAYANDSSIYIGGFQSYAELWPTTPNVVELYMIDKDMNLLGYKELGGKYFQDVWGIIATEDDGCLIYCTRYSSTEVERDVQIWKVNREDINIITHVTNPKVLEANIRVYPNPATDHVFIQLGQSQTWQGLSLSIYTINGKKVFQKRIDQTGSLLEADITNLKPDYYLLSIDNKKQNIFTSKILKQ
ncbi:MAG: hypothetical protein B6I19_05015 [Bacteroidetes bacterium 4572_114]|nr:MAG: hypothetical protein B6I19_05015 [Bacteroidetes bacterium 4572_114]